MTRLSFLALTLMIVAAFGCWANEESAPQAPQPETPAAPETQKQQEEADNCPLTASLTLGVDKSYPAGCPILVEMTISNTGSGPIYYWCGGPATYPGVHRFKAVVSADGVEDRQIEIYNGQFTMGSGFNRQITSGASITFPVALGPLPAGSYRVKVESPGSWYVKDGERIYTWPPMAGKEVRLLVQDDAQRIKELENKLLADIRKGSPFARHVAVKYEIMPVLQKLLKDMKSDDVGIAFNATCTLSFLKDALPGSGKSVNEAMTKHLTVKKVDNYQRGNLLVWLAQFAAKIGTDEAMKAVLALAHSSEFAEGREQAVEALGKFKQEEAFQELEQFQKDSEPRVRNAAVRVLLRRSKEKDHNPK